MSGRGRGSATALGGGGRPCGLVGRSRQTVEGGVSSTVSTCPRVHGGEKQAGQEEQSEEFGPRDVELVGRDEGRVGGRERASSAFQSGSRSLP